MRRLLTVVAVIGAAMYISMPPRTRELPPAPAGLADVPRGAIHVHTNRSDGSGSIARVAREAARAGLQFVVLTDHGDGTRATEPPAYHDGVLVIDAVEISSRGGHVLALGMPKAPYPLGGEARDVVEDIARLGGFAIAAHPTSLKPELQWSDWNVPVGGIEYLNGDSQWRDESVGRLARALFAYPVRPVEAVGLVVNRDEGALRRWDRLTQTRRVMALAGADAHARLGFTDADEPYTGRLALPIPSYESVFRAFSIALPQLKLTRDPEADSRAVLQEIRQGRVFSTLDSLARRPAFSFTATSGGSRATGGEVLPAEGPVRLSVDVQGPPTVQIALIRNGLQLLDGNVPSLRYDADATPAVYRVEVQMPGTPGVPPAPWIVSNPIYVGRTATDIPSERTRRPATERADVYANGPTDSWTVEHSAGSQAAVNAARTFAGTELLFRYAISGTESSHPYAALVSPPLPPMRGYDRITFRARADRTMRISVQLRAPGNGALGERWHRSVYVDTTAREISVFLGDMTPRGATSSARPNPENTTAMLFVVDTANTPVGAGGQLFLDDVRYER